MIHEHALRQAMRVTEPVQEIVDVGPTVYTIQVTGASDKLDAFLEAVGEAAIVEVVRSGVSGIARGEKVLSL